MERPRLSVVHGRPARPQDLPAVDRLVQEPALASLLEAHGHSLLVAQARALLQDLRERALAGQLEASVATPAALSQALATRIRTHLAPRLRPVINLTGTVIHTNLGRALLPQAALEQVQALMAAPNNLEYDLDSGGRGERDELVEPLLCELTGAEAATVVNNNAGAVLLTLAALAAGRETIVSRGELVEIGGSFRIPDVMTAAGTRLVEVGTTNRTHPADYERAIGPDTALLMKVHTSNYRVQGFARSVDEAALAELAQRHELPLVSDLGSGALIDMAALGLPPEPTPQQMLRAGCDVVTFSGDKLLGGPQAGFIVGQRDCIERIRRHPLKRALRLSKLTLAALEPTLRLYLQPERLVHELPTLRLLTRPLADIEALAGRLQPPLQAALGPDWQVEPVSLQGQIGSGSLPVERLASAGLALAPLQARGAGGRLQQLAEHLRQLPMPVIGRIHEQRLLLDMRCLEDERLLLDQLETLHALMPRPEADTP